MDKQVKISTFSVKDDSTSTVKKDSTSTLKDGKVSIVSALIDIPFSEPDYRGLFPLPHVIVTLCLSDDSSVQFGFDLIQGTPLDAYVKMSIGIYNQRVAADSSK